MYVELKNIEKSYGTFKASKKVNFAVEKGELIGLLGPSGSGKTTILRMIAGLETPDGGDIYIDGKRVNDLPAGERGIGFVFQNYALFQYMNVYDNIAFGLKIKKTPKAEIKKRVTELIQLVGLAGMEKRFPGQLSGGQRQRVAFARALAPNPQLLLLDEPFAAIDAKVRAELRTWLRETITTLGITSIFVTHDQDEAIEVADKIIVTNKGRIEQMGDPQNIYSEPASPFVADFIGQSDVISNIQKWHGFHKAAVNEAVVRSEFVRIAKLDEIVQYEKSCEEGVVKQIAFRGSYSEIKVLVNGQELTARRSPEDAPLKKGEQVRVFLYRVYLFVDETMQSMENSVLTSERIYI